MLEIFRKKVSGLMTIAIISVIVLAFAFWGLGDYFLMGGDRSTAAVVEGKKISWARVEAVANRLRTTVGQNMNEQALKEQVRIALVQRQALLSTAERLGFQISDEQVAETLLRMPAFQQQGKFSKDRYLDVLKQAAYTDKEFRKELSQDLLISQMEHGLVQSNFSLENEILRLLSLAEQKRDFGYFQVDVKKYRDGIKIDPKETAEFYDKHKQQFITPEQVSLEYVALSVDDLAKKVTADDHALNEYYEKHKASYTAPEARKVRHILLVVPPNSPEEDAKALSKITNILEDVKKGGDFAALAKEHSMDPGSKSKGGDLGWFTRGQMVPEFEQAAFSMKESKELAGPIRSQFGYHILQLIDKKAEETRSFASIKELVKEQYQRDQAAKLFSDNIETMSKLAFENSSSLQPLAQSMGLKVEQTDMISRQGTDGIFKNPQVLQAAFSDEVLKNKHNSEPVRFEEGNAIVLRVKAHKPSEQQTLAMVEKQIEEKLILDKAQAKARETADTLVKELNSQADPEQLAQEYKTTWQTKKKIQRNNKDVDSNLLSMAFQSPKPENGAVSANTFPGQNGDHIVLAVTKVHEFNDKTDKIDEPMRANYQKGLTDLLSQLEFNLYTNQVFSRVKAEFNNAKK